MPGGAHNKRKEPKRGAPRRNEEGSDAGPSGAQPEPYDGPGSNAGDTRGRSESVAATRSSRPSSQAPGPSQNPQVGDPERRILSRNVDFGGAAYNMFSQVSPEFV